MDMSHSFWEKKSTVQQVKYESCNSNDGSPRIKEPYCCDTNTLNFSTGEEDCVDYPIYRKSSSARVSRQDPLSHRIIEKRRRDRMNNCLADLSRLIPPEYLKKGRGRVEKTEIIEMAIKHMKHLQYLNHYRLGYQECMSETMKFMVEVEGHFPREPVCVRLLGHLQQHCDTIYRTSEGVVHEVPASAPKAIIEENNNTYDDVVVMQEKILPEKHTYKYKNDIKLRFTQDTVSAKTITAEESRRSSITSLENQSSSHSSSLPGDLCARMSPDPTPYRVTNSSASQMMNAANTKADIKKTFSVPIFALHTKGSFYVPLTVDYGSLLPYLDNYDLLNLNNDCVLHPIAINVNFKPPVRNYNF